MHTHHAGDHVTVIFHGMADKPFILQHRLSGLLLSVPVRNLIAETGADPQGLCRLLNGRKTVWYAAETGMMIENRSHAVFNAVNVRSHGA